MLCDNDANKKMRIDFMEAKGDGSHVLLSSGIMTLKGKALTASPLSVKMLKYELKPRISFMDYIFGGCQIALTVAIDYTGSNGDQSNPRSLHSHSANNQYLPALRAVCDILQYYDSDKLIPMYGFGAKLPNSSVMHSFAVNGDAYKPEVFGL